MLISQYANLPENCDGFWVEKLHNKTHGCSFLVYHRGLTEFCDSISKAKKALRDRRASLNSLTVEINVTYPDGFLDQLAELGRNRRLFP